MASDNRHGRPTVCRVDLEALRWNFQQIRSKVDSKTKILSMVKANAYGHGAPQVARVLGGAGSDAFGVATVEEGIELRRAGVRQTILVVAGIYPEQIDLFLEHGLTPVVYEPDNLRCLEAALRSRGSNYPIHLKIDTGMGRIGFPAGEIGSWLPELKKLAALKIEGVFSHFSHA